VKYLGVDFGLKRVGLAISEGELASAYKVIEGTSFSDLLEKIKKEAIGFDKVVIGLPEGRIGKLVKKAIKKLKESGIEVAEADETLSTQNATREMIELNIPKRKRKVNDAYAAAGILQNYLDEKV